MKVVILTGGSGYIGKAITNYLYSEGYRIFNIDINDPLMPIDRYGNKYTWFGEDLRYGLDSTKLNVRIRQQLKGDSIIGIIHLAAYKDLTESIECPLEYYDNNVKSTLNMLELAQYFNVKKIIYSSSAAVYDDLATGAVKETFNTTPDDPYGYSKLICEKIIMDTAKAMGSSCICLRYQNPVGCIPGVTVDESESMFGNVLNSLKHGKEFHIFGGDYATPDGTCIRDYVDINDLAKVHIFLLNRNDKIQDIFNFGTGKPLSCLEVCEAVKKIDSKFTYKIVGRRKGDAAGSYADTTKLRSLGYKTEYTISDTIEGILVVAGYYKPTCEALKQG